MSSMARQKKLPPSLSGAFTRNGFPLVEFDRRPLERWPMRAFVLGWGPELTLVQTFNTDFFQLGGYTVFRNSDVRRWREIAEEDFLARAAAHNKVCPSRPKLANMGSMRELVASAGASFSLIAIHRERIKKDVCYIGKLVRVTQRAVTIQSITPQAEWEGEETYQLKDITLLEFGGVYENLLSALAKPAHTVLP
jgi:hypothetical protein